MRIVPVSSGSSSTLVTTPAAPVRTPSPDALRRWPVAATITDPRIIEVSGLVSSRTQPGVLWVHNDSGDRARIFAIDAASGSVLGEVRIDGVTAWDWEDLAQGPGPSGSGARPWLYVGDIGDNARRRTSVVVHRFAEPRAGDGRVSAQSIALTYPDGARNAEAMFVDPVDGDLYLVSKVGRAGAAELYRATASLLDAGGGMLERVATTLPIGPKATGADIRADGSVITVTTYEGVYAWRRRPGESVVDALARAPRRTDGTQAETIATAADGVTWIAIREGACPVIRTSPVRA